MAIQVKGKCVGYQNAILIASLSRLSQLFELTFGSDPQDQAFTADAILLHGEAGVGKFCIWLHYYHCKVSLFSSRQIKGAGYPGGRV